MWQSPGASRDDLQMVEMRGCSRPHTHSPADCRRFSSALRACVRAAFFLPCCWALGKFKIQNFECTLLFLLQTPAESTLDLRNLPNLRAFCRSAVIASSVRGASEVPLCQGVPLSLLSLPLLTLETLLSSTSVVILLLLSSGSLISCGPDTMPAA